MCYANYNHMKIKCPQCEGEGFKFIRDARNFFRCTECGLECLLKLLANIAQKETLRVTV